MYFSILHTVISACLHSVYFTIYNVYCIILCVVIWLCLHCVYNVVLHVYFNILHVVIWVCLHSVYNCVIDVYLTILHGVISVCITQCNWGVCWWFYNVYFECVYTPICINTLCKITVPLCLKFMTPKYTSMTRRFHDRWLSFLPVFSSLLCLDLER